MQNLNLTREIISPLSQFEIRDLLSLDAPTVLSGKFYTMWVKLSNSGETLELQVPSYIRKGISGWSNYSCMVTILKASEKNVGNRGSKSAIFSPLAPENIAVKEQRVNGSWHGKRLPCLRYTLMGFERNYHIIIPSPQVFAKQYSTNNRTCSFEERKTIFKDHLALLSPSSQGLRVGSRGAVNKLNNINPFFITGFTDGEGSFMISVKKSSLYRQGWKVQPSFVITLHKKDLILLQTIKDYLGVGSIDPKGEDIFQLRVFSIVEITNIIIPHFDKYPLLTQKKADFELFKLAVHIMNGKGHLTPEGLQEIVNIKASMNKGLSINLKQEFPNTNILLRPVVGTPKIQDPNWLAGFSSAEGCFYIKQRESINSDRKIVEIIFSISQHSRDENLIKSIVSYLGSGRFSMSKKAVYYTCSRFSDIWDKILPFFLKFEILGVKSQDFKKWSKVCEIVKSKDHLTTKGFNEIREIKASMNETKFKR
jgi:hypothetical protein